MIAAAGPIAGVVASAAPLAAKTAVAAGSDFSSVMANLAAGALDAVKSAEASSLSAMQGKAQLHETVDALLAAERSLQTVIAVRDKVIAAYQEISRMQI
ncbi:MAG: flagellar hook-basal body complex protein FliE [Beijerinckiaceae bacterium]